MLKSTDPYAQGKDRPMLSVWFGNFFEPFLSDRAAVRKGLEDVKAMGFNQIVLDSKLWKDFSAFFQGSEASDYIDMQLYIVEQCRELGLGVSFLALYNCGDNLHPAIRDAAPEFIEQPIGQDGNPLRGYRHWSEAQTKAHLQHCMDLHRHISKDTTATAVDENGNERLPFYFYHSPAFTPSFDKEGIRTYLDWLKKQYSLDELNERYQSAYTSIDSLTPADYWVGKERFGAPTEEDYANRTPVVLKFADNQRFKQHVMSNYMRDITTSLREAEPRFWIYSCLTQWNYLMTEWIHIYWRGLDLWDMGEFLDSPSFFTMPADACSEADPYVVSMETAMMRSAANGKDFAGGLFFGRYVHNDIYAVCTPSEVIASSLGAGAAELTVYGYTGLDDGGNFGRWPEPQKQSVRDGFDWFSRTRRQTGRRRASEAALLFPQASFVLTTPKADDASYSALRNDALGWYRQLADHGINPDVLHPRQVHTGALDQYKLLVMPADPEYWAMPDPDLEAELRRFAKRGGVILRSGSAAAAEALGIEAEPHAADSIDWTEKITENSKHWESFGNGEAWGTYIGDGKTVIAKHGSVYSFGFWYGHAYIARKHNPVPEQYGRDNHYPLTILEQTPVDDLLIEFGLSKGRMRGIERVKFENGFLWINHTAYPHGTDAETLQPHQAVFKTNS